MSRPPHGEPADCPLCRRHAWSFGVVIFGREYWVCRECAEIATELKRMRREDLSPVEQNAVIDAGEKLGAYLDGIGETDLAKLSPEQYFEVVKTVWFSAGASVREQIKSNPAPF